MKIRLLSLFITIIVGLFVPQTVHAAEQTLRVSPVIINIQLSPDKVSSQTATVENLTNQPLPIRATLNDFLTSGEEGGYVFEESKENPLLQWIDLSEEEFILGPKEKKTLQVKITTPKSIPVGGYYGILFFEPVLANETIQATQVNSKVGILMLANVGVPDSNAKRAEILDFSPQFLNQTSTVPFLLRVQNISLNFFTAKPEVQLTPVISMADTQPIQLEEKIIFPGKIRRWTEDNAIQNLSPNIYKAAIRVSTGNGQVITQEKYFIVFPYLHTAILLIGLIILIFLIVKRKRLKKAIRALIRP